MAKVASSLKPSLAPSQIFCQAFFIICLYCQRVSFTVDWNSFIEMGMYRSNWRISRSDKVLQGRTDGEARENLESCKNFDCNKYSGFLLLWTCSAFTVSIVKLKLRLLGHGGFSIHSGWFRLIGWILYGLYNSLQCDATFGAAKHEQWGT